MIIICEKIIYVTVVKESKQGKYLILGEKGEVKKASGGGDAKREVEISQARI